jgi:hypothetical protein
VLMRAINASTIFLIENNVLYLLNYSITQLDYSIKTMMKIQKSP